MNATRPILIALMLLPLACDRPAPQEAAFRAAHDALVQYHSQWRQTFPRVVPLDDPSFNSESLMRLKVEELLEERNLAADAAGKPRIVIGPDRQFAAP